MQMMFIAIAVSALFLLFMATQKNIGVLLVGLLWITVSGFVSYLGFFENTNALPPRMGYVLATAICLVIAGYQTLGKTSLRPNYLIAIHILRIPVEIGLYQLFMEGKVPVIMTFQGWNFDILIGISALVLLLYRVLSRNRIGIWLFRIWNLVGILFLLLIVLISVLSAPSPIQVLAVDTPNLAMLKFPYTLLPAVIVPIVLLSHLLCLRKSFNP